MLQRIPSPRFCSEGAVAVEPVQCVVHDGMDNAFAEVVENHDLAGEPAGIRNPADHVLGHVEAVFAPTARSRGRPLRGCSGWILAWVLVRSAVVGKADLHLARKSVATSRLSPRNSQLAAPSPGLEATSWIVGLGGGERLHRRGDQDGARRDGGDAGHERCTCGNIHDGSF